MKIRTHRRQNPALVAACALLMSGQAAAQVGQAGKAPPKAEKTTKSPQKSAAKKKSPPKPEKPKVDDLEVNTNPQVLLKTNKGEIVVELFRDVAPVSTENFLQYMHAQHYNGTVFHRVIKDFMIQGGGYSQEFIRKSTRDPIINEATNGKTNVRGTLSMARTRVVESATAQWFINVRDNPSLDHIGKDTAGYGYAVFGHVIKGMDIVDAIAQVETGACGRTIKRDCPVEPVIIEKVETFVEAPPADDADKSATKKN